MNPATGIPMNAAKPVVVVTSDEPWSDVWHTQIHFANQLSNTFNVLFIGPPLKWTLTGLLRPPAIKEISSSLMVFNYWNPIPSVFQSFSVWVNDLLNQILLDRFCASKSWRNKKIVWHFDRYRSVRVWRRHRNVKHLYHVIDPVADLNYDRYLSATSDLVVVVSKRYLNHYQSLNKNLLYQGQGFDASLMATPPVDKSLYHEGSVLLLGTMLDDVDYELLISLAARFPDRKLVLIGPDRISNNARRVLFDRLLSLSNVIWTGPLPPEKHLAYVWSASVCVIAYEVSGKSFPTRAVFGTPLKVMTYLGCLKPVVTTIDCEIPELNNVAIFEERDAVSFIDRVDACLHNRNHIDKQQVISYLHRNTYPVIIDRIINAMDMPTENGN